VFKTTGVDDSFLITAWALLRGEMNSDIKELKDLVKQALKQNGDPGRQLAGDRYVHDPHAASVDRMGSVCNSQSRLRTVAPPHPGCYG